MKTKLIVFGTRPELIKLIPLIKEIGERKLDDQYFLLCTHQHQEMLQEIMDIFDIEPDYRLPVKNNNPALALSLAEILKEMQLFLDDQPNIDLILAEGDTTSCLAAAMTAFMNKIPFAHLEAGLRTYDLDNPYPEEYFRRIIALSANIHFAPTPLARENLLQEKTEPNKILMSGNTIVDMMEVCRNIKHIPLSNRIIPHLDKENIIITCHRRENQNGNFKQLIENIISLAEEHSDLNFIWLSHLNPFVTEELKKSSLNGKENIHVIEPVNIINMIALYEHTKLIITDSGGLQEEAVSFSIPVIVIREKTERMEAVTIGNSVVVGNSKEKLKDAFMSFINKDHKCEENPFGDGQAASRILDYLSRIF